MQTNTLARNNGFMSLIGIPRGGGKLICVERECVDPYGLKRRAYLIVIVKFQTFLTPKNLEFRTLRSREAIGNNATD